MPWATFWKVTDQLGNTTTYGYDNLGRKTSETSPQVTVYPVGGGNSQQAMPTTTYAYDRDGNLLSTTDPDLHTTWTDYDPLNRAVKTVSAQGSGPNDTHYATTTTFDAAGNVTSVTDPDGNVTSYVYDNLNRPIETIDPLHNTSFDLYDLDGNVIQATDADGRVIQYVYNAVGGQTQENWLNSSGSVFHTIHTYYDTDGETVGVTETDTTNSANCTDYAYTYNADGDVLTSRMAPGDLEQTPPTAAPYVPTALTELDYTYNADGSVHTVTDSSNVVSGKGGQVTYSYDAVDDLTEVTDQSAPGASGVTAKRVNFTYNAAGQPLSIIRRSGLADNSTFVAVTNYTTPTGGSGYDGDGRLVAMQVSIDAPFSSTQQSYGWQYDAAGNVTQETSPDGTDNYTLDNTDQLKTASLDTQSFSYDQNGNRTNNGYQTGADNRLMSDGTFTYQYDKDGNRTVRTRISSVSAADYATLYSYDYENRLVDVIFENNSFVKTKEIQYTYDYAGRLIRTATATDASGSGTFTYLYSVYDGDNELLEFSDSTSLGGSGTPALARRDLYGAAVDQILATDDYAGHVLWGLADQEGTIRDVVNNSGGLIGHRTYDSFGNVQEFNAGGQNVTSTGTFAGSFPFAYTGQAYSLNAGLCYYHARWYDSLTGQFTTPDPAGAGTNLYAYAGNSPVENIDPSGECYSGFTPTLQSTGYQLSSEDSVSLGVFAGQAFASAVAPAAPFAIQLDTFPAGAGSGAPNQSVADIAAAALKEGAPPTPAKPADDGYNQMVLSEPTDFRASARHGSILVTAVEPASSLLFPRTSGITIGYF